MAVEPRLIGFLDAGLVATDTSAQFKDPKARFF